MIPGINLLNIALSVIGSQPTVYTKFLGNETMLNGGKIAKFADPVPLDTGSVQAIDRANYQYRGLNFNNNYADWFISYDVIGLGRDYNGDVMEWDGRRWQITSVERWTVQDGWAHVVVMEIPPGGPKP